MRRRERRRRRWYLPVPMHTPGVSAQATPSLRHTRELIKSSRDPPCGRLPQCLPLEPL